MRRRHVVRVLHVLASANSESWATRLGVLSRWLTSPAAVVVMCRHFRQSLSNFPIVKSWQLGLDRLDSSLGSGKLSNEATVPRLGDAQTLSVEGYLGDLFRRPDFDVRCFAPVSGQVGGLPLNLSRADEIRSVDKDWYMS